MEKNILDITKVPHVKEDFSEPWTDEKQYKKYDLSPEEIAIVEKFTR